jgi:hypothetical protein
MSVLIKSSSSELRDLEPWSRFLMMRLPLIKTAALMISSVFFFLTLSACTDREAEEPVKPVKPEAAVAQAATPAPVAPPPPPLPLPPDPCVVYEKLPSEPSIALDGKGVVLTRMMKACVTREGNRGFEKGSPYLAMGVPCTGGSGRVDIKGHYHNPKLVSFIIGTDCLMNPSRTTEVQAMLSERFGLTAENKLLAYTPFVVQYWEIPGASDADVGFSVDLRSTIGTQNLWKQFRANSPIRVELYGRENAWVKGESFYHVTVDLVYTDRKSFRLDVNKIVSLTPEQVEAVKMRCEELKPKRKCLEVF